LIVEDLNRIKNSGEHLGFVNEDEMGAFAVREGLDQSNEFSRIRRKPSSFPRIGQVNPERIRWKQRVEEERFPRLPGTEEDMDVGP
jgi:hypothetical protein